MTIVDKVLRGSPGRISRFHDRHSTFAMRTAQDWLDAFYALATAILRVAFGYHPRLPLIALPATRFLRQNLQPKMKVFEWGSGMSTLWYEGHCAEIHSVEDQYEWYRRVQVGTRRATVYYLKDRAYVDKIREFPDGYFDLISIDGGARLACLEAALEKGGAPWLLLDDTDSPDLSVVVSRVSGLSGWEPHRFTGFSPGQFYVQETTILRRVAGK